MLEQLTTEELKAELQAREKALAQANSPLNETGFACADSAFAALLPDGEAALHLLSSGTIIYRNELHLIGSYYKPCTREDFMQALENNFTKIREALK